MSMTGCVKLAIIDSGVDKRYLEENVTLASAEKIYVSQKENEWVLCIEKSELFEDYHGTKVMAAVSYHSQNAKIECYSFNVFDKGKASSYAVREALEKCLSIEGLEVIVMSLSCDPYLREEIEIILEKLYQNNVSIFCSVKNRTDTSFPADSKYVFGVRGELIKKRGGYCYEEQKSIQLTADHGFEFFRVRDQLFSFSGNSKANANMAGIGVAFIQQGKKPVGSFLATNIEQSDFVIEDKAEEINWTKEKRKFFKDAKKYHLVSDKKEIDTLIGYRDNELPAIEALLESYVAGFRVDNVDYYNISTFRRMMDYVFKNK